MQQAARERAPLSLQIYAYTEAVAAGTWAVKTARIQPAIIRHTADRMIIGLEALADLPNAIQVNDTGFPTFSARAIDAATPAERGQLSAFITMMTGVSEKPAALHLEPTQFTQAVAEHPEEARQLRRALFEGYVRVMYGREAEAMEVDAFITSGAIPRIPQSVERRAERVY